MTAGGGFFNTKKETQAEFDRQSREFQERERRTAEMEQARLGYRQAIDSQAMAGKNQMNVERLKAMSGENKMFYPKPLGPNEGSVEVIRGTERDEQRYDKTTGREIPKTNIMQMLQALNQQKTDQGYTIDKGKLGVDQGNLKVNEKNAAANEAYHKAMATAANTKANAYEAKTEGAPKSISYVDQEGNKGTAIWNGTEYEPFVGRKYDETPEDLIGRLLKRKFDPAKNMSGYQR